MGLAVTACEADGSYPRIWPVVYRREPMGSELEQPEGKAWELAEVAVGCPGAGRAARQPDRRRAGWYC